MTTLVEHAHAPAGTKDWKRFARWAADAWQLLRRAPLRLTLLVLAPLLVEAALQAVPRVGVVLSKCVVPVIALWALLMIDARMRTGRFAPVAALRSLAARPLHAAVYTVFSLLVFVCQMAAGVAVAGLDQAWAVATGNIAAVRMTQPQLMLMLAGGVIPAAVLLFPSLRLALSADAVGRAVRAGLATTMYHAKPVSLYALCTMGLLASLVWMPLVLLFLLPWFGLVGYAAHRDVGAA